MVMDYNLLMEVAEKFGVAAAFSILFLVSMMWQSRAQRDERREWRESQREDNRLTRAAIENLSTVVHELTLAMAKNQAKPAQRATAVRSNKNARATLDS
jgi:hypothetical protein